ncbi:MAG: sugar phosphate isomerase/epimerase [Chloroflexi bacterium]|jgi:sugar phosphate isomerase/epimerase|nr:sugar phosphate isomerase/epimerase [Chloroflexota bacterium]
MYRSLAVGPIGVKASLAEAVALASAHGFAGVSISRADIEAYGIESTRSLLRNAGLVASDAGLPVDFRTTDEAFERDMQGLQTFADMLKAVGCERVNTWLLPGSDTLPYAENLALHRDRLGAVASVLAAAGVRLGLEYVGPATARAKARYPFVHNQTGLFELIDAIGGSNLGLLLDAYHWYTSGGNASELRALTNADVVLVHVNDAPAGVAVEEQLDLVRRMPGETGVIDMATFMGALVDMGYDGPVVVEPFSDWVRQLPPDGAVKATADSLDRIWPQR